MWRRGGNRRTQDRQCNGHRDRRRTRNGIGVFRHRALHRRRRHGSHRYDHRTRRRGPDRYGGSRCGQFQGSRHDRSHTGCRSCRLHRVAAFAVRPSQGLRCDDLRPRRHRLRSGHRRDRHHRRRAPVHKIIHGGDVGDIVDGCNVTDISCPRIAVAGFVGREVSLARPQRHPTHRTVRSIRPLAPACPNRDTDADADETHQRRRINRSLARPIPGFPFGRNPAPARSFLHPAPIMRWREPPGSIVDPGPTPRRDIAPMPVAVRHPGLRDRRIPDRTVLWAVRPIAHRRQLVPAGHRRHHRGRCHACGLSWARHAALIGQTRGQERVGQRRHDADREIAGPFDPPGLHGRERQRRVGAVDAGRTLHDRHGRRMIGIAGHDFVGTGRNDRHRPTRRRDAVDIVGRHRTHPQEDRALRLRRLHAAVVQHIDVEFGGLVEREIRLPQVDVRRRTRLRPECIAGGDGVIHRRRPPLRLPDGVERHRAQQASHPADTRWRIDHGVAVGLGAGAAVENDDQGEGHGNGRTERRMAAHEEFLVPPAPDSRCEEGRHP